MLLLWFIIASTLVSCTSILFQISSLHLQQPTKQDMMYMGSEGIYSHTFVYEQKSTCPVCTTHTHRLTLPSSTTLNTLLQQLCDGEFRLKAPSITSASKTLYMRKPVALEKATKGNLDKTLKELISSGEELVITDPVFPSDTSLGLVVTFED